MEILRTFLSQDFELIKQLQSLSISILIQLIMIVFIYFIAHKWYITVVLIFKISIK